MKQTQRTINLVLLFIILFSNMTPSVAYAAQAGDISLTFPTQSSQSATSASPSALPQPGLGNILGSSTSLLAVGTQSFATQNSAFKRTPIMMQMLTKKVYQTDEPVIVAVTNPDNAPVT